MTTRCRPQDVNIPAPHQGEGIRLCLDRAEELLRDASFLAEAGRTIGGAVLLSQAAEEIGKAALLREARDAGTTRVVGFRDHQAKLRKAAEVLPPGSLMVNRATFDASQHFDADVRFGGTSADDWTSRLRWLYVDWDKHGQRWLPSHRVNSVDLRKALTMVLAFYQDARNSWRT